MTAAGGGAIVGAGLGIATSIIGMGSQNKATIGQIDRLGENLSIEMRAINQNREQLDRELGDILSDNALLTAKNMATAKVLMSTSGTVGGTTAQVSKQAYIDQIQADAQTITKARNQEYALLNQAISRQVEFRNQANALRSKIPSPLEGFMATLNAGIQGATSGAQAGQAIGQAMPKGGSGVNMTQVRDSQSMQRSQSWVHQSDSPFNTR